MVGRLLVLLILWFACPTLSWAEDEFCGPMPHLCGVHPGQLCHCLQHRMCTPEPHPQTQTAPVRPEALCPRGYVLVAQPVLASPVVAFVLTPLLTRPAPAPELPPPRSWLAA